MGSHASLNFAGYNVLNTGSFVNSTVMTMFREEDKKVYNRKVDGCKEVAYEYSNTVKNIKKRLDVVGFSISQAQLKFEKYTKT